MSKKKKNEKIVLSEIDLALRWGVSKMTLRRWRETGDGPKFFQTGDIRKKTYYPIAEVIKYEQGNA